MGREMPNIGNSEKYIPKGAQAPKEESIDKEFEYMLNMFGSVPKYLENDYLKTMIDWAKKNEGNEYSRKMYECIKSAVKSDQEAEKDNALIEKLLSSSDYKKWNERPNFYEEEIAVLNEKINKLKLIIKEHKIQSFKKMHELEGLINNPPISVAELVASNAERGHIQKEQDKEIKKQMRYN